LIEQPEGALDGLIAELRRNRGDPRLTPEDFAGWSRSARFDPLLYMLTRAGRTRDWASGIELSSFVLGKLNRLELHRTFPKALLYRHRHSRSEVNALANFTFLTQDTNLVVSDRAPADYLQEFAAKRPGAIESHWIPGDPRLWQVENYPGFLAARRELLAKASSTASWCSPAECGEGRPGERSLRHPASSSTRVQLRFSGRALRISSGRRS
jgi:hypothetical protein